MTPILWSWFLSPFAAKARIVLAEKGIDVELVEIDPRRRPARLRELNPAGRVPVLEIDGLGIPESTEICEWADSVAPDPPLWPADVAQRARARALTRWVDEELTRSFFLSMRKEAFGLDPTDHPDVITALRERLTAAWGVAERLLGETDGPWLMGGETPTLADLAAIPVAVRVPQWKPELAPAPDVHPGLTAWLAALRERPSAAEVDRRGAPVGAC